MLIQGASGETTMLTGINQVVDKLTGGEEKSRWLNAVPAEGFSSESIVLSSLDNFGCTMKHDFMCKTLVITNDSNSGTREP